MKTIDKIKAIPGFIWVLIKMFIKETFFYLSDLGNMLVGQPSRIDAFQSSNRVGKAITSTFFLLVIALTIIGLFLDFNILTKVCNCIWFFVYYYWYKQSAVTSNSNKNTKQLKYYMDSCNTYHSRIVTSYDYVLKVSTYIHNHPNLQKDSELIMMTMEWYETSKKELAQAEADMKEYFESKGIL